MKVLSKRAAVFTSLLLTLVGVSSSTVISTEDNLIYWKESERLKWSDFIGPANTKTSMQALTFSSVKVSSHSEGNEIIADVVCFFDKNKSWTKDTTHALLLKHEQLHFDITELHARIIRQKISLIKEKDPKKKLEAISKTVQSVMNDCRAEQDKYDEQTQHGILEAKQDEWVASVKKRLTQYAAYKSK